ncbi:MAG: matrixin family metalloprotease [Parcubacteria group bacterium]|nr:matrixin family metalloprotease [Parcubacteria group bacterium]
MKKLLGLALVLGLSAYAYTRISIPCAAPITFTLGTIDPRFNISKENLIKVAERSGTVWSNVIGKELFAYDPKGDVVLNLVYDERQANADKNETLKSTISSTKQSAESVRSEYLALESTYKTKDAEYNTLLAQYKKGKISYEVLEKKRVALNNLAGEINMLINKYNALVGTVNKNVEVVNQTAGQEFEEGQYVYDQDGKRINIFEFKNQAELERVLTHEFGHALGLEHNSNPDSIMYYLNQSTNVIPKTEEITELKAICGLK